MSELDLPQRIGGKYRPIRLLGKGGMGAVYEVEHEHTGQRLALKVLTQQPGASVERFRREARAASLIKSVHIVRITDADQAPELGGAPYLVMELLEGQDLERATGDRPTSPEQVLEWLRPVARALGKAHDAGLVHRDLKPENLFLTRGDDGGTLVKILDFGIAKMAAEASALTASDTFLGTPGYMAPEQTDSRGPPVTFRADLFALGLITFKLLTGRSYWRSGSLAQMLSQILAEPMPPASERGSPLGPAFDQWFRRACDRDPQKRFGSASEQVEALAAALGLPEAAAPSHATPVQATQRLSDPTGAPSLNGSFTDLTTARRRTARRRLFGGGAVASLVGLGVAAALVHGAMHDARAPAESAAATVAPPATTSLSTASAIPAPALGAAAAASLAAGANASAGASPGIASASLTPAPEAVIAPAASSTAPRGHPSPVAPIASTRAAAAASGHATAPAASGRSAAPHARDPLEGPW